MLSGQSQTIIDVASERVYHICTLKKFQRRATLEQDGDRKTPKMGYWTDQYGSISSHQELETMWTDPTGPKITALQYELEDRIGEEYDICHSSYWSEICEHIGNAVKELAFGLETLLEATPESDKRYFQWHAAKIFDALLKFVDDTIYYGVKVQNECRYGVRDACEEKLKSPFLGLTSVPAWTIVREVEAAVDIERQFRAEGDYSSWGPLDETVVADITDEINQIGKLVRQEFRDCCPSVGETHLEKASACQNFMYDEQAADEKPNSLYQVEFNAMRKAQERLYADAQLLQTAQHDQALKDEPWSIDVTDMNIAAEVILSQINTRDPSSWENDPRKHIRRLCNELMRDCPPITKGVLRKELCIHAQTHRLAAKYQDLSFISSCIGFERSKNRHILRSREETLLGFFFFVILFFVALFYFCGALAHTDDGTLIERTLACSKLLVLGSIVGGAFWVVVLPCIFFISTRSCAYFDIREPLVHSAPFCSVLDECNALLKRAEYWVKWPVDPLAGLWMSISDEGSPHPA